MRSLMNGQLLGQVLLLVVFCLLSFPVAAGDTTLSNNSGDENAVFFIKDEPSLVINGFDLTPLGLELPTALDAVSISVSSPVAGSVIDLVIYQDANGGSPVDAELIYRQQVRLDQTGVNRIALDQPAIITEPVVWVGFYLPVDFRFHADQSGPSVLTYWAWSPASTFDVAALSSAAVLGPGDGSEPVAIEMDGVARITAEVRVPELAEMGSAFPLGQQIVANVAQDTSILQVYQDCNQVLYDPQDNSISHDLSFPLSCRVVHGFEAPHRITDPTGQMLDVQRGSQLYKIETWLRQEQLVEGRVSQLPVRVTHCLRVPLEDLDRAVIGEVREHETVGDTWYILPSVRFNDLICAEVSVAHYISYFVPRATDAPPEVNLVLGWTNVDPHPLRCGENTMIYAPIVNTGRSWFDTASGHVKVTVEDFHVATGIPTVKYEQLIPTDQFGPGVRRIIALGPINIYDFLQELHQMRVQVDVDNAVPETNETDNVWFTEYVLVGSPGQLGCAHPFAGQASTGACPVEIKGIRPGGGLLPNEIQISYSGNCTVDVEGDTVNTVSGANLYRIRDKNRTCTLGIDISLDDDELQIDYFTQRSDDCGGGREGRPLTDDVNREEKLVRIFVESFRH